MTEAPSSEQPVSREWTSFLLPGEQVLAQYLDVELRTLRKIGGNWLPAAAGEVNTSLGYLLTAFLWHRWKKQEADIAALTTGRLLVRCMEGLSLSVVIDSAYLSQLVESHANDTRRGSPKSAAVLKAVSVSRRGLRLKTHLVPIEPGRKDQVVTSYRRYRQRRRQGLFHPWSYALAVSPPEAASGLFGVLQEKAAHMQSHVDRHMQSHVDRHMQSHVDRQVQSHVDPHPS